MAFTTRGSLLSAVRRGDEVGWQEFYDMYKPLILLRGGDLRLTRTEKEELVQLVMLSFFNSSRTFRYDKSKGRFRDYLRRIIHARACDILRRVYRQERIPYEEQDEALQTDLFEEEWREHILSRGMEKLKETICLRHYQIFYLLDVQHRKVKELAELYKVPPVFSS